MDNDKELVLKIARTLKSEMREWRESMEYYTIETFVGCFLARLRADKLITAWEESVIRQKLEE